MVPPPRRARQALLGRPESVGLGDAARYYDAREAADYHARATAAAAPDGAHQAELARRCEDFALLGGGPGTPTTPLLALDAGCGSGLSGRSLRRCGAWVGVDISADLLHLASSGSGGRRCAGVVLADLAQGLPFRAGVFDYVVSTSVVQWLCRRPVLDRERAMLALARSVAAESAAWAAQFYPNTPADAWSLEAASAASAVPLACILDYPHGAKVKESVMAYAQSTHMHIRRRMRLSPDLVDLYCSNQMPEKTRFKVGSVYRKLLPTLRLPTSLTPIILQGSPRAAQVLHGPSAAGAKLRA